MPILANGTPDMLATQTPFVPTKGEPTPPAQQAPAPSPYLDQRGFDSRLDDFMKNNPGLVPGKNGGSDQQAAETAKVVQELEANQTQTPEANESAERKALIKADKERRAAKAEAKTLKEKAAAYEKLMAAAQGDDPTALISEAGLDLNEYYNKLIKNATKDVTPKDPVQKAKEELLAEFNAREAKRDQELVSLKDQLAKDQAISTGVLPMLASQADKYETILALHNGDIKKAAEYIFNTAFENFDETGKALSFEQVADNLEAWHFQAVENGHMAASKLKKFAAKYGGTQQQASVRPTDTASNYQAKYETPANNVVVQPQEQLIQRSPFEVPSQEDRMLQALKRAGLQGR